MMTTPEIMETVSAVFCCPQTTPPDEAYLTSLHRFLSQHKYGRVLLDSITTLADRGLWEVFASKRDAVRRLTHGQENLAALRNWASDGVSGPLATARTNVCSLPLLSVVQIGQYLQYLNIRGISHQEFLAEVREGAGGIHGYCEGLPAAICIACSNDEGEIMANMATAMKIIVGVGAYAEAADVTQGAGNTMPLLRLKKEGQAEEIINQFPDTYVAGITAPRSVSIGGPAATLHDVLEFIHEQEGIRAQPIQLGGIGHNPENLHLAHELSTICHDTPGLQLPEATQLLVPLRSNQTGHEQLEGSLTDDVIYTMLAVKCEWLSLLKGVAQDLSRSPRQKHGFLILGLEDCVTTSPFYQEDVHITKISASHYISQSSSISDVSNTESVETLLPYSFHESAIAIVGASCRLPGAANMEELWHLLAQGTSCVREVPTDRFNLPECFRFSQGGGSMNKRKFYGNFLDDIKRFDHAFFGISAREAVNMDPQQRIMLELSFEALEDAGYLVAHQRSGDDVGCFMGLATSEYFENTDSHAPTAYTFTGTLPAFLCGRLSHFYGWSGPSEMFNTACSSSMVAINRACKAIQSGECRMALAGGVCLLTGVNNYLDLAKAGFLSPNGQCKPFQASADGYCRSDGAGLVVLKKLEDAMKDGDSIWGVIPSVATNQSGLSSSLITPDANAQQALYRTVLKRAGFTSNDITYVEAHGTGTQVGDPVEIDSVRAVFGSSSRQNEVHVGSIKANIGHCESAAGVVGLLKVLTMLRHGQIPPQAHWTGLNPKIAPLEPVGMAIPIGLHSWDVPFRAAMVNSYGAGGSNAALICCEPPRLCRFDGALQTVSVSTPSESPSLPLMTYPFLITAACEVSLLETAQTLGGYIEQTSKHPDVRLADIAFTLNQRRQRHKFFASVKAKTAKEAACLLKSLSASDILQLPDSSGASKPIVLAFAGQASCTIALRKSLYDSFPTFRSYLNTCETYFGAYNRGSLLSAIFQVDAIDDVAALQCGTFAVQYACARCWIDAGARPRAVIGHSLGEITAMAVAGILSLEDSIKLLVSRACLIESKWSGDKGAMLAVECTAEQLERLLTIVKRHKSSLEVACFNGPSSFVLAGSTAAIDAAEITLSGESEFAKTRSKRLHTSHGFHSHLIEPILAELEAVSQSLEWKHPQIPVYSCTADQDLEGVDMGSFNVARHTRQPVFFEDAVHRIESTLGSCVWLEVGLDTAIMSMARKACRRPNIHTFQAVTTRGLQCPSDAIAEVVGSLWHKGIFLSHWDFVSCRPEWLPPYQFVKTQHWLENIDRVMETKKNVPAQSHSASWPETNPTSPPPPLVTRRGKSRHPSGYTEFLVNTLTERYTSIVDGHKVCSYPLCPAAMYMECASAAVSLLLEDETTGGVQSVRKRSFVFEEFHICSPLGINPPGEVVLRLEGIPSGEQKWKLTVVSATSKGAKEQVERETVHAEAILSFGDGTILNGFKRLVSRQMQSFISAHAGEKLHHNRAYKLFEKVMKYDSFFMGIQSVQMNEHDAIAAIEIPRGQPQSGGIKSWPACDTVVLDICMHTAGLVINTTNEISSNEVAVMVGLDRAILSPSFKMDDVAGWKVFASTTSPTNDEHQFIGDVYVFSLENDLVASFTGIRLTRVPISKLERVFNTTFAPSRGTGPETISGFSHTTRSKISPIQDDDNMNGRGTQGDEAALAYRYPEGALRELVAECTMVDKSDIPMSEALAVVGLDSLGSAELSEELSAKFSISVSPQALLETTLVDLQQHLGVKHAKILSSGEQLPKVQRDNFIAEHGGAQFNTKLELFFDILTNCAGARREDIKLDTMLAELGVDSLSFMDLKQEVEQKLSIDIDLKMDTTVYRILAQLGISSPEMSFLKDTAIVTTAAAHGVSGYCTTIRPFQDEITVAYILEAFAASRFGLKTISSGAHAPNVPHVSPKYDELLDLYRKTLQKGGFISITRDRSGRESNNRLQTVTRGNTINDVQPASQPLKK
ncbi:hypothetical protein ANO14919_040900 [Xylariales sp. No.14919]|nr:hypothetical protein ANO14919_040900 [Xylariales sp. No.14919]